MTNDSATQPSEADIQPNANRYGARVYLQADGVVLVKQTIKQGTHQNAPYVIDAQREQFVDPGNDAALGAAVRSALLGQL
jgi:hypothetical protein